MECPTADRAGLSRFLVIVGLRLEEPDIAGSTLVELSEVEEAGSKRRDETRSHPRTQHAQM